MDYLVISLVALLGSGLTLFSGFGLGTLLVPVFGLFFPIQVAIALTAIVHFLNNLFKLFLLGRKADKNIVIRFGLPAIVASFAGALLLSSITLLQPIVEYELAGRIHTVLPVKLVIALLLIFFAVYDLVPSLANLKVNARYLPLGGLLSGFFGGLSGNQGALRSAFLIRAGLGKEQYVATGVVIACLTDISRLSIYSGTLFGEARGHHLALLICATLSAFAGAYAGNRLLKKLTIALLQKIVAVALVVFGVLLGAGVI